MTLQSTAACLSTIIVMQVVNVFLCKSADKSVFAGGWLGNRMILWGVIMEIALILAIDYTTWGHRFFGTAPLAPEVWLVMLPFAFGLLLLEEGRKWVVKKWVAPKR